MPYSKYKQRSKRKSAARRCTAQKSDKETDVGVDLQETVKEPGRSTGAIPKIRTTNSQKKTHGRKHTSNKVPSEAESFDMELRNAIRIDDTKAVYHILSKKAFYELQDSNGDTCLHLACEYGQDQIALLLIVAGADINQRNKEGHTPLHTALYHKQPEIADIILVLRQKSLNLQDEDGNTPLHIAAKRGYVKLMGIMVAEGADISLRNNVGCTPLHIVLSERQLICLPHMSYKQAIEYMIPEIVAEPPEDAPSNIIITSGDVTFYLSKITGPRRDTDVTYLYYEETISYMESFFTLYRMGGIAKKLVAMGHSNSLQNVEGDTPLHLATRGLHRDIVWWLLYHNACTQVKNANGISPLQEALRCPQDGTAKMILAMCALRGVSVDLQDIDDVSIPLGIILWEECKAEVQQMKGTKVGQSSVTYYDFATEPFHQLAVYLQNEDIRKVLLDGDEAVKFPDYDELMDFKVKGAEARRVLSDQFISYFTTLPGELPSLPLTSIHAIVTFLSDQDIKNFVEAFECKVVPPTVYKEFI